MAAINVSGKELRRVVIAASVVGLSVCETRPTGDYGG